MEGSDGIGGFKAKAVKAHQSMTSFLAPQIVTYSLTTFSLLSLLFRERVDGIFSGYSTQREKGLSYSTLQSDLMEIKVKLNGTSRGQLLPVK